VHESWNAYFRRVAAGEPPGAAFQEPPTLRGDVAPGAKLPSLSEMIAVGQSAARPSDQLIRDHIKVLHLIRAYQVRGHNKAKLDPLNLSSASFNAVEPPELQYQSYGFTEAGTRSTLKFAARRWQAVALTARPGRLRRARPRGTHRP